MIEEGATHLGVATDHVIESFRNQLWSGYKTGEGIEPALLAQFQPLEDSLADMGIAVWPMTELEADDALASAAALASGDLRVQKVCIWTPDKDLAQCVCDDRIVQVDRKSKDFPAQVLGERRDLALSFKRLATLRTDAPLFADIDELQWRGPTERFSTRSERLGNPRLLARARTASGAPA